MSPRERLILSVKKAIGRRNLVFVGIRGHDAAPLLPIPQFQDCFAVAAPLGASSLTSDLTLEQMLGRRLDLDTYDYDQDTSEALKRFRAELLRRLREPCVVSTYRPSHFLWNAGFASLPDAQVLGMFKDRQAGYEYKPWVEQEVARLGLNTIPWRYVADEARELEASNFTDPVVLRASRLAGGAGVALARSPEDVLQLWPAASDHLVAVGPYLEEALPINVGACVYSPDDVALHPASIQLIGIDGATTRHFGYCGNDFAAFAQLERTIIEEVDRATRLIGQWLGADGYRGAFGADFLWHAGQLYFSEVNPRLQGSTALSSFLAAEIAEPDIVLDHVAATLGLKPRSAMSLLDWTRSVRPAAHVVVHNVTDSDAFLTARLGSTQAGGEGWDVHLRPASSVSVAKNAILSRVVTTRGITDNGYRVDAPTRETIARLAAAFGEQIQGMEQS